jgi:phosphatidylglycerophosphate synthase
MVALASGRDSKVGELYNEVPDRVSDAALFIGAGYAWGGNVVIGYVATILAIFTAYIRAAGKSRVRLTNSAGQWPNNTGCWSLPLPVCIP